MQSFISREQDYALRISARLASLNEGELISIKDLSNKLYITKGFAARIVHTLIQKGIINSKQGSKGGVYLAKDASEISLLNVMTAMGFKLRFNVCLHEGINCELNSICKFHGFFRDEENKFYDSLKNRKLSEFTINN